jgi:hypothetical protein
MKSLRLGQHVTFPTSPWLRYEVRSIDRALKRYRLAPLVADAVRTDLVAEVFVEVPWSTELVVVGDRTEPFCVASSDHVEMIVTEAEYAALEAAGVRQAGN